MYGPVLIGERVRLEPPTSDLVPLIPRWFADTEVNLYTLRFPPSQRMVEESWLEKIARSETEVMWMITAGGRIIGTTGIDSINWRQRRAETAIVIGERGEWGKGYATEAVRLRARFAFRELNLEKLMTEVIAENAAMIRALQRAGYRQYGLARRHFYQNGRWSDMWLGELLREEWEETEGREGQRWHEG